MDKTEMKMLNEINAKRETIGNKTFNAHAIDGPLFMWVAIKYNLVEYVGAENGMKLYKFI